MSLKDNIFIIIIVEELKSTILMLMSYQMTVCLQRLLTSNNRK